ncbi:FtsX-like permease family protein [Salinicoccus sp. HZC-1]|uniref:FtsX-like permease family protein n=1 Tax=Salinicoccus sp. HZC-1 TaxID=3385497 RepID=UPI00398BABA3
MSLNTIVLKNFFKNIKNYTLYIFALIFSVALYFSFVLMSKDESAQEELSSGTLMSTGFLVGSVLLVFIIVTFVMFANSIFLKRRNKELALFQLIGLSRNKVFRILLLENAIIYFGSLFLGIGFGFLVSRLLLMILLKVMQIELPVGLNFSMEAVVQTAVLYIVIFALLMIQNFAFLKRTRLINMLNLNRSSESANKKLGTGTVALGIIGLAMVILGYWLSVKIFDYPLLLVPLLFGILGLTIIGTYLTFKFSVAFLFNMVRKSKKGHVNVNDVLSLTSIMFKMKSNAFLLTLISVVSALSMGLMSLSYISYYSIDKAIDSALPNDYVFYEEEGLEFYEQLLSENGIKYDSVTIPTIEYSAKDYGAISVDQDMAEQTGSSSVYLNIVSDAELGTVDVGENETILTGIPYFMKTFMDFKTSHPLTLVNDDYEHTLELIEVEEEAILSSSVTYGSPVAVVDEKVYDELNAHYSHDETPEKPHEMYALDIVGEDSLEIYELMDDEDNPAFESKISQYTKQMQGTGMMMFIIGFVGFAFLLTSGCILYFKQIGESEDEKGSYQVLRKLGFSEREIMKGLSIKMIITFGVPLLIGLLHTYFAVNAGWFLFGTAMWTPMLTVMAAYVVFYSVFALLSLMYYRKVVKQSM